MEAWWQYLRGRPFYWVLDGSNAAADLFMLRFVLERPEGARALRAAQLALDESVQVQALLAGLEQEATGDLWSPRYSTALWRLRLLAEVGARGDDERVAAALDAALARDEPATEGEPPPVNLDAILLHVAAAFGFHEDERAQARLDRVASSLRQGALPESPARTGWLAQAALALAAIPPTARPAETLERVERELARIDLDALPHFCRARFPTFDRPDLIATTRAALMLGLHGEWLRPWVERVAGMQDAEGLWRLEEQLPAPDGVSWAGELEGAPSRWISAQALYVLRAYYGDQAS